MQQQMLINEKHFWEQIERSFEKIFMHIII